VRYVTCVRLGVLQVVRLFGQVLRHRVRPQWPADSNQSKDRRVLRWDRRRVTMGIREFPRLPSAAGSGKDGPFRGEDEQLVDCSRVGRFRAEGAFTGTDT